MVTPDEEVGEGGIAAAWAGGYNGRQVIDRVLPLVSNLFSCIIAARVSTVSSTDQHVEDRCHLRAESALSRWSVFLHPCATAMSV